MKKLLILTAVVEGLSGLILFAYPHIVTRLLFGSEVVGSGVFMSRIAGISLFALAVACWPDRNRLRAFFGMLTYGLLVMPYLVYVGGNGGAGILLWPGVAAHAGLSVLLVRAWRKERQDLGVETYKNTGRESATLTPAGVQKSKEPDERNGRELVRSPNPTDSRLSASAYRSPL